MGLALVVGGFMILAGGVSLAAGFRLFAEGMTQGRARRIGVFGASIDPQDAGTGIFFVILGCALVLLGLVMIAGPMRQEDPGVASIPKLDLQAPPAPIDAADQVAPSPWNPDVGGATTPTSATVSGRNGNSKSAKNSSH